MPKYLLQASYTTEGTKGLLQEGDSSRRSAVQKAVEDVGGKLKAFYYAFGESDGFVIVDVPDNASAAAIPLAINATGAIATKTTARV